MLRPSLSRLLVAALLLGLVAAALPSLRGDSGEEAGNLRALGATVVSLVLGCAIGFRIGGDLGHGRRRIRRTGIVSLALALATVHLPAWLAGSDFGLTRELAAQVQYLLGWRRPIPMLSALLAPLLISWVAGRLVAVRKRPGRRSRIELLVVLLLGLSIAATAVSLLSSHGAIDGREITTKLLAIGLMASVFAAAAGRSTAAPARFARFVFVLCVAFGGSSLFALAYVTPSARDLVGLELEVESEGWTVVAGPLRGRSDVHGVFVLPPGGRRLELLEVRPGPADLFDYRPPQVVDGGLARRVGDSDVASVYSDDVDRDRDGGEIRIRSRRFPFLDRATGFELEDDVISWTLAPSGRYLVVTCQIRPEPSPAWRLSSAPRLPRFRLELRWRDSRKPTRILLDDQGAPAQVIALDDRAIRFLRSGTPSDLSVPSPEDQRAAAANMRVTGGASRASSMSYALQDRYLAIDSYDLVEDRWIEGPRSDYPVGQELRLSTDRRQAIVGCTAAPRGTYDFGTCRIDLETLQVRARTGALPQGTRAVGGKSMPLSGDRLGVVWYVGGNLPRPIRDWRFTTFDPSGRELATVRVGDGDFFSPSRELEDGTLAIARPPVPSPPIRKQVFDWTLESLDLLTGARRELAAGVAPARIRYDETPELFLTRDGRIVLPVAAAVRDAALGTRSAVTPLPSTGRTSVELRSSLPRGALRSEGAPST